ncbi:REP-associated tyrosine transposase [Terriglobus albidus]|uniref:REP-associated tyrosine transposase n=1 Tax=Terriglobus albidus TaxID=1592106 RepID=UPI0021DFDA0C|nr:transposase [Terriglobus albidus]
MHVAPQEVRTFHVTFVTAERRRIFQAESNIHLFLDVLQEQRDLRRLNLHAFVIMPNHVHLLITPAKDIALEKAIQYIKGNVSHRLPDRGAVWQRGYNETRIRDAEQFAMVKRYIELNPVRARFVEDAAGFLWSSANSSYPIDPMPTHFMN